MYTGPAARRRRYVAVRVRALAVRAREERAFPHVADNVTARRLYRRLGFRERRAVTFRGFRSPG